ncbi:MAG: 30S ribosome-binding factor RbfA [Alphaproteobacteria bacterium]|nr:30S ribosome-binding factor RbfA [Alphaproteobacteria bacterium]
MAKRRPGGRDGVAGLPAAALVDGPSQRQLRVGELLRATLIEVLQREELRDPELTGLRLTVSEVRVSPDLKQATCFVWPFGLPAAALRDRRPALRQALARAAPWLGSQLAGRVRLKFAPRLSFVLDESFDRAERMEHLLKDLTLSQGDGESEP